MARVAPRIPEAADMLCEHCGYVLNGLAAEGRCPECGQPVADSVGTQRLPTAWDIAVTSAPAKWFAGFRPFFDTTCQVIFRPGNFYRTLAVRVEPRSARSFAVVHWWIAGFLFALTAATHADWFLFVIGGARWFPLDHSEGWVFAAGLVFYTFGAYWFLDMTTRLAARLTTFEGTYRGYRVPVETVRRAMYFHAAHYLPVSAVAAFTVVGFRLWWFNEWRLGRSPADAAVPYLYTLCGLVIVSAVYLFWTYWAGMKNILYANR